MLNEIQKVRKKKFTYFIGIDVSRDELDYAVMQNKILLFHKECRNDEKDTIAFVTKLKEIPGFKISKAIFCMENTGIYCNPLLQVLKKLKANISLEHPMHIKRSFGLVREKSDKSDAIKIAAYAQKNTDQLRLWLVRRPVIVTLTHLSTLRNRLLTTSLVLTTPIDEQKVFIQKQLHAELSRLCDGSIAAVKSDLVSIEHEIKGVISRDERLKKLYELILSVPGIGFVTAIQVLISTNEFLDINNPKKFASYAGVSPFKRESGKKNRGAHISAHANKKMKMLLHICSLRAIKSDDEIKRYYERKTKMDKKPKMVVINAVRSKLILRLFACVNQNRAYSKNYIHHKKTTEGELVNNKSLLA